MVRSIASAICCIAAIAGLANQESARTGNILGIAGVAFGLSATVADMSIEGATVPVFEQTALLAGVGSGVGAVLASGVGPTELPQTVAAFHSLVGLAAMAGAAGEYFGNVGTLDAGTLSAIYLATFIGGITATGSLIAFGKLAGILKVRIAHFEHAVNNFCFSDFVIFNQTNFYHHLIAQSIVSTRKRSTKSRNACCQCCRYGYVCQP